MLNYLTIQQEVKFNYISITYNLKVEQICVDKIQAYIYRGLIMAKILSVDDSKSIRDVIQHILSSEKHDVISAADGQQALEIARSTPVDIALVDINMPNMNGISLVSKLRRLESYQYIPIIMVTTETDEYRKKKAKSVGATGWLAKPITAERLISVVNKLVS